MSGRVLFPLVVRAGQDEHLRSLPVVDEFLHETVCSQDLVWQTEGGAWCIAVVCPQHELEDLLHRFQQQWTQFAENCPLQSFPQVSLCALGTWSLHDQREFLQERFYEAIHAPHAAARRRPSIVLGKDNQENITAMGQPLLAAGYDTHTSTTV